MIAVASERSLPAVLRRIVESACTLVDARFGALGVIGDDRHLSEFITVGVGPEAYAAIGNLPEGHGILGLLIVDPEPLRLRDLGAHAESYGFPPNHPPMHSFLGVPVRVRDAVFGNLYLTEKRGAEEFDEEDERLAVALAAAAGLAIENARLIQRIEELAVLEDRERIARDLHDKVIQHLFSTGMALQTTLPTRAREDADERIGRAVNDLDETIREIRDTIFALQAPPHRGGLRLAIFSTVDEAREPLGFTPELHLEGPLDTGLPEKMADHLLAVLREALSNVVRHAGASRVDVSVVAGGDLVVRVADNGRGFPILTRPGRGLRNLEERASAMHGTFTASRSPDGDTVVEWRAPLTEGAS
jgi:two-component system, NarL family, sensor histidine kinase DevS